MISCFSSRIPPVKMSKAHSGRSTFIPHPPMKFMSFLLASHNRGLRICISDTNLCVKYPKLTTAKILPSIRTPYKSSFESCDGNKKMSMGFKTDRLWKTKRLSISWKDTINAKKLYRPSTVSPSCLQGSKSSVKQRSFQTLRAFI